MDHCSPVFESSAFQVVYHARTTHTIMHKWRTDENVHVSYSLKKLLTGGYIEDYIGEYYNYKGF